MDPASDWVVSGGKGALDFDGTDDWVNFATVPPALRLQVFTLSAWVNPNTSSGFRSVIGGAIGTYNLQLVNNTRSLALVKSFIVEIGNSGANVVALNQWSHVAATYAAGGNFALYINGSSVGSGTNAQTFDFTGSLFIGRNASAEHFLGQIDDVTIFNTALTASEIREIYRLGRGYGVFPEPDLDEGFAAAGFNRRRRLICGSNC
jgi:hypothetical protein